MSTCFSMNRVIWICTADMQVKGLQYQCTSERQCLLTFQCVRTGTWTDIKLADCSANSERFLDCHLLFQGKWCCWTSYSQNCSHVRVESWSSVRWLDSLTFWKTTACSEVSSIAELMVRLFADWTPPTCSLHPSSDCISSLEYRSSIRRFRDLTIDIQLLPLQPGNGRSCPHIASSTLDKENWRHIWSHVS